MDFAELSQLVPTDLPQMSEIDQRAFYAQTLRCALEAQAKAGAVERFLEVAGISVRLVFAGPTLEREFMGAIAHLETPPNAAPKATFHLFDTASTGVSMPPPPCTHNAFTDRGDIWGMSSRLVRSAFHWSEYSVSVYDTAAAVGAYWVQTTKDLPYWAKSSPIRTLFHWLMEDNGLQLVHAAAIGTEDGGALVTGKGGVGKSSTALAGLVRGLKYIGDDYLIVGLDPEPTAYTLYSTAKLEPHQLERFPELKPLLRGEAPKPGEKAVIYLYPDRKDQIVRSMPLKRVFTPKFNDKAETEFEPVSSVELHHAAAFTTMSQLPHAGLATHEFIGRLIQATPNARILLGSEVREVPLAIARHLSQPAPTATVDEGLKPLVTVVIPIHNGAHFLRDAIDSILAQNYPALEIIVVDDGSKDDIDGAVAALPIDIRFLRQPNEGPSSARNNGVRNASGELVAFLDADDLWPEGTLPVMVDILQRTGSDIVKGKAQVARVLPDGSLQYVGNPDESFGSYIGSAVYRRSAFDTVGFFDLTLRFGEDIDWFQRAEELGTALTPVDQVSLIVRRHATNMTQGKSLIELAALRVLKKAIDRKRLVAADTAVPT